MCEGFLILIEVLEVFCLFNWNKCFGLDGFIVEFYVFFWDKLGEILVSVFNYGLVCGDLLNLMKVSVMWFVYKKDDKWDLKNWWLIFFLNVDYKICFKVIFLCLVKVFGFIIDLD